MRVGEFDKIVPPKNLFDNKITLINYGTRFDMRKTWRREMRRHDDKYEESLLDGGDKIKQKSRGRRRGPNEIVELKICG